MDIKVGCRCCILSCHLFVLCCRSCVTNQLFKVLSDLPCPLLPQMGGKLQSRADSVLLSIDEELKALTQSQSQSQSKVELTLDTSAVEQAIKHMSFMQMKRKCRVKPG